MDFIRKINNLERIPENSILVTMDMHSLYTSIPNNEGIKAVKRTLKQKKHCKKNYCYIFPPCFNPKQFHLQLPKLLIN